MTTVAEDIASTEKFIQKLRTKLSTNNEGISSFSLDSASSAYWFKNKDYSAIYHKEHQTNGMHRGVKALMLFVKKLANKCPNNTKLTQKVFEALNLLFKTEPLTFVYPVTTSGGARHKDKFKVQELDSVVYNLRSNKSCESIWYLFFSVVAIYKDSMKKKNSNFANLLLRVLTDDWLQIAFDYFGLYFEEVFTKELESCMDTMYMALMKDVVNNQPITPFEQDLDALPSNFDNTMPMDSDFEEGFELDLLIDYCFELSFYLSVAIQLRLSMDALLQKVIRLVFFILDELEQAYSLQSAVLLECTFLDLLSDYATTEEICITNSERATFTLQIYENTLTKMASNTFAGNYAESADKTEIECVLASALEKIVIHMVKHKSAGFVDISDSLNLEKWSQMYKFPDLPFGEKLNQQLFKIFSAYSTSTSSSIVDFASSLYEYFEKDLKDLKVLPAKVSACEFGSSCENSRNFFEFPMEDKINDVLKLSNLDSTQLISCLRLLGKLDCTLTQDSYCLHCDVSEHEWHLQKIANTRSELKHSVGFRCLQNYILNRDLFKLPNSVRVELLLCLKRIFNHFLIFQPTTQIESPLFKFLAQCCDSDLLKIRVTASQILVQYFTDGNDEVKMQVFKLLENKHPRHTIDTRLGTWTHLALSSRDDILDLLLLKLMNSVQSNDFLEECMAITEINYVASQINKQTPYQLLSPVLPVIVKNQAIRFASSPGIFKKLSKITHRPLDSFLIRFQGYIIPSSILIYYQKDILQQISNITKLSKHTLVENNMSKIVAFLLVKENVFSQKKLMTIISNCDSSYKNRSLQNCFDIYQTLSEICQLYDNPDIANGTSEAPFSNMLDILKSLYFVFDLVDNSFAKENKITEPDKKFIPVASVSSYEQWIQMHKTSFEVHFSRHILGIFHYFNKSMCDDVTMITYFDKMQIINGITFAIQYSAETSLASCLPQISMSLQVGMEILETRYQSFKAWYYLINALSLNQLLATIDIPICFIQQKWKFLDDKSKKLAYRIFGLLLKDNACLMRKPAVIYSLMKDVNINLVEKHKQYFNRATASFVSMNTLEIFTNNLISYKNKYVVLQTLYNIEKFLKEGYKDIGKLCSKSVENLLGILLEVSYSFKNVNFQVSLKATECISYLGITNFTAYKIKQNTIDPSTFVYDLNVPIQQKAFMKRTINEVLVPSFWQTNDLLQQSYIAFAMQEYLIGCDFDSRSCNFEAEISRKEEWDLSFNELSRVTLEPLRSSKYNVSTVFTDYKSLTYPCYDKTLKFQQWINLFTSDIIKNIAKFNSNMYTSTQFDIFKVYCSLMKTSNIKFCEYMLPYAITHVLTNMSKEYTDLKKNIVHEILIIFKTEISLLNRHQVESLKMCYQTIFKVLEYLKKVVSQYGQKSPALSYLKKPQILEIEQLIQNIPLDLMAKRSLEIDSFERAVLYLEQSYRTNTLGSISMDLLRTYLQTAYSNIQDTDAIDGVLKTFTAIDLPSKLDELLYGENWDLAQKCLDELSNYDNNDEMNLKCLHSMNSHQLFEQSLIKMDKVQELSIIKSLKLEEYLTVGLESSVMTGSTKSLNKWNSLAERSSKSNVNANLLLNYNLNKALLTLSDSSCKKSKQFLENCFAIVTQSFVTSPDATTSLKIKDLLTKLHYLYNARVMSTSEETSIDAVLKFLNKRLAYVGDSFSSKFEIMCVRNSFAKHIKAYNDSFFNMYFDMSRLSKQAHRLDLTSKLLMDSWAQPLRNDFQLEMEYADLLWEKNEKEKALKMVGEIYRNMKADSTKAGNHEEAAVLLKYAQWCDASNSSTPSELITSYKKVCDLDPQWAESYFQLGIFYSKYLGKKVADEKDSKSYVLKKESVKYLLLSLKVSTIHVREALPKVVTYWLDTADSLRTSRDLELRAIVKEMCTIIDKAMSECPVNMWYTVLVQFISRILHSHGESAKRIQKIVVLLALHYPQFILWYVFSMINSSETSMSSCGKAILKKFRASGGSSDFASSAYNLVINFSKICKTAPPNDKTKINTVDTSLEKDFGIDMNIAPSAMAVPVQKNFGVSLPLTQTDKESITSSKVVSISQLGANYAVFASLRKPKKIQLFGSDGKCYEIMCKMEDVRQDDQYMQFAQTVGFLLSKDPESQKRNLGISTYFIMSLHETYGIIELVPNVITVRSMLAKLYQAKGIYEQIRYFHQAWDKVKNDDAKCLELYHRFTNIFKPVLHEWFLNNFPDPILWYSAKQTFSRSYAVMCMVGHILGLGDRHCDNILIDVRSGHVLHVDYDILFEKGKDLPVPEKVPFRLTQNIVDALGITGLEGTFRRACEVSLDLVRNNDLTLLNIIEIMMYGRSKSLQELTLKTNQRYFIGRENQTVSDVLKVIRNKMKGIDPIDFVAISVPAQVEALFQEATDEQTLSKMYMGWLAIW
ncbi:hypothetical protein ACO0RG_003642 [Hanseniaspora osmophila]